MNREYSVRTPTVLRGLFVGFLVIVVIFLLISLPMTISLPVILGLGLLMYSIVHIHARRTVYLCRLCSTRFTINAWIDFTSPHLATTKLLCCPHCGKVAWHPTAQDSGA